MCLFFQAKVGMEKRHFQVTKSLWRSTIRKAAAARYKMYQEHSIDKAVNYSSRVKPIFCCAAESLMLVCRFTSRRNGLKMCGFASFALHKSLKTRPTWSTQPRSARIIMHTRSCISCRFMAWPPRKKCDCAAAPSRIESQHDGGITGALYLITKVEMGGVFTWTTFIENRFWSM